jgi:hypothetical protein
MKNVNQMKTKIFLLATALVFASAAAFSQGASAVGSASATIVTPITITETVPMDFGNVAVSAATGGTVVLPPIGGTPARTVTGGVTLPNIVGTPLAGAFAVTGTGAYTYAITLPTAPVNITGGSTTMSVSNFVSFPLGTGALTAGLQTIYVGATLNVAAAQLAGVYTATGIYTVHVDYN